MAKEELLEFEGAVTEVLPDGRYRVTLDNGHEIVAYTAGRMKRNRIKTIAGDRVSVEIIGIVPLDEQSASFEGIPGDRAVTGGVHQDSDLTLTRDQVRGEPGGI